MRFRLFPQNVGFFDLFTQSAENALKGAHLYLELTERYDDPNGAHKIIRDTEHRGDELTHEIIRSLNTTFVTPIDREDIHALATQLDDIMDFIEAAADLYHLHQIEAPTDTAKEQARILVRICEQVAGCVAELRKFKDLAHYWNDINQIEKEGDQIYRRAVADLFRGDHKALEVLRWKEIYEQTEMAIDACEKVGNILEAIVLKHA
ncbi:MAG: DUF47 domain-containing protein [Actinomycetota bacterium]